jgi:hypothetical protein
MRSNPLRWLLLAGVIHITLTVAIFLVGKLQLLPALFDTNGIGLTFAIDSASYRSLASQMVAEWQAHDLSTWLAIKAPLHCRLYSIAFALLGRAVGHNILAAEPLNLFYYLGILCCVYWLGREIFDERAALLGAIITGAWPSFLFHSTQLLRDSISILCLLGLMLLLTMLLSRALSWRSGAWAGVGGAALVTLFWLVRGNMWNMIIVAVAITIVLLLIRMIRGARLLGGNVVVLTLVIATMLLVPSRFESTPLPGVKPPATPFAIPSSSQPEPQQGIVNGAIQQIGNRRAAFRFYNAQASNIDRDVRLNGIGDILRFLPRATVIGFFAPFPRMWFEQGNYGRAGRLLTGVEMCAIFFLYAAAGIAVWQHRGRLRMWLIAIVAAIGIIALGLVVANAAALYRLRYVFWFLLFILAAKTITEFRSTSASPESMAG